MHVTRGLKVDRQRISLCAVAGCLCLYSFLTCGCADDAASATVPAEVVFVDLETKQPVVAPPASDVPAAHPETGRRTLMPGLYCAQCKVWHVAPPLEELQRNPEARQCPKCGGALKADGPLP